MGNPMYVQGNDVVVHCKVLFTILIISPSHWIGITQLLLRLVCSPDASPKTENKSFVSLFFLTSKFLFIFFIEHAGELHIFILREKEGERSPYKAVSFPHKGGNKAAATPHRPKQETLPWPSPWPWNKSWIFFSTGKAPKPRLFFKNWCAACKEGAAPSKTPLFLVIP